MMTLCQLMYLGNLYTANVPVGCLNLLTVDEFTFTIFVHLRLLNVTAFLSRV